MLSGVVLALLALYFYLYQGDRMARGAAELLPRHSRCDALRLGRELWATLGAYVRAQLLVEMLDAVFIGLGLWLLGVPLVFPLALLIFVGAQVPVVVPSSPGSVAVLVALAHGGLGLAAAALAVIVTVQLAEGHFLEPLLMSWHAAARVRGDRRCRARLRVLGVLGALLAVPVAACLVRTVQFLRQH